MAFHKADLSYAKTIEWKKRSLVGPRLQAALEGSAKLVVEHKNPAHPNADSRAGRLEAAGSCSHLGRSWKDDVKVLLRHQAAQR